MARLGSKNIDARQDGARARSALRPRVLSVQRRPSPASSSADALLIIGTNPRREAPVLNARIRKRWRAGQLPIGVIGEQADLTYHLRLSRRRPETLRRSRGRQARFAETLKGAERPLMHRRRRRADARRWRARSRRSRPSSRSSSAPSRTAGTASACCTTRRPRVGAPRYRLRAGRGRPQRPAQMAQPATLDVLFLLGADEIEVAARAPSWSTSAPMATDGAHRADVILPGAAYTGEVRHLRQHRRPRADGEPRRLPAGRGPRGLGDPARAVRRARREAALRLARRAAPGAVQGACRICSASTRSRRATRPTCGSSGMRRRRRRTRRRSQSPIQDFYLTNPIARASARHGRMFARSPQRACTLTAAE